MIMTFAKEKPVLIKASAVLLLPVFCPIKKISITKATITEGKHRRRPRIVIDNGSKLIVEEGAVICITSFLFMEEEVTYSHGKIKFENAPKGDRRYSLDRG